MQVRSKHSLEINLAPLRVLVADESEGARTMMRELLVALGCKDVTTVSALENAAGKLQSERFDLCIIDFHLTKDTGPELVKRIRADEKNENRKIPVLMTCSRVTRKSLSYARNCGAHMVMTKPFSAEALYDRLAWIAHHPRMFVFLDSYKGPDRRFHDSYSFGEERRKSQPADECFEEPMKVAG